MFYVERQFLFKAPCLSAVIISNLDVICGKCMVLVMLAPPSSTPIPRLMSL